MLCKRSAVLGSPNTPLQHIAERHSKHLEALRSIDGSMNPSNASLQGALAVLW